MAISAIHPAIHFSFNPRPIKDGADAARQLGGRDMT
jgi:hypothetical protein